MPSDRLASLPDEMLVKLPLYLVDARDAVVLAGACSRLRALLRAAVAAARASAFRWSALAPLGAAQTPAVGGTRVSNGGRTIRRLAQARRGPPSSHGVGLALTPVLAAPPIAAGLSRQRFRVVIDNSATGDGDDVRVGVSDDQGERAWALDGYHGAAFAHERALKTHVGRAMDGDLRGRANGAVVEVVVERRRLGFRVNGGALTFVDVRLPEVVRPWAQVTLTTGQLTILGHEARWAGAYYYGRREPDGAGGSASCAAAAHAPSAGGSPRGGGEPPLYWIRDPPGWREPTGETAGS